MLLSGVLNDHTRTIRPLKERFQIKGVEKTVFVKWVSRQTDLDTQIQKLEATSVFLLQDNVNDSFSIHVCMFLILRLLT